MKPRKTTKKKTTVNSKNSGLSRFLTKKSAVVFIVVVAAIGSYFTFFSSAATGIIALPGANGSRDCEAAKGTKVKETSGSKRNASVCQMLSGQTIAPIYFQGNNTTSSTSASFLSASRTIGNTGYMKVCYTLKNTNTSGGSSVTIGSFLPTASPSGGSTHNVSFTDYTQLCDPTTRAAGTDRVFMKVNSGSVRVSSIALTSAPAPVVSTPTPPAQGQRCELWLHSAGSGGRATTTDLEGDKVIWPTSPTGQFWEYDGAHNNQYDPGVNQVEVDAYNRIRTLLSNRLAQENCGPTVVIGQSSGGGAAAKLLCKGETFGNRVFAYVLDDPVKDDGIRVHGNGCKWGSTVKDVQFVYSTEHAVMAAGAAKSGKHCSWDPPYTDTIREGQGTGWYCEDNRTMSVEDYGRIIGVTPHWHRDKHYNQTTQDHNYDVYALIARAWNKL